MADEKPSKAPLPYLTLAEKAAADRAELYMTHKNRGTLGIFYQMFPDERRLATPADERGREGGHDRER